MADNSDAHSNSEVNSPIDGEIEGTNIINSDLSNMHPNMLFLQNMLSGIPMPFPSHLNPNHSDSNSDDEVSSKQSYSSWLHEFLTQVVEYEQPEIDKNKFKVLKKDLKKQIKYYKKLEKELRKLDSHLNLINIYRNKIKEYFKVLQ